MWVRNQWKDALLNCETITIKNGCGNWVGKYYIDSEKGYLGVYSTKEKALKVLDELQHYVVHHPLACYQMPQDSEVE